MPVSCSEVITPGVKLIDDMLVIGDKRIPVQRTGTNSFTNLFSGGQITVRSDGELEEKRTLLPSGKTRLVRLT